MITDIPDDDFDDLWPDKVAGRGPYDSERPAMRAYVLQPEIKSQPSRRLPELGLAEGISLANALPALQVVGGEVVRLARVQPGMLFGSGKIAELKARFKADDVGLVLIDGPATPIQQRNLEKEWGVKVLDRTGLILEIFADRARTREGVLQVELAALSYQRTRLVRAWTHLERQRGGFGFVGGPGETQLESDRRAIDDQVVRLRRQLAKVVKTRHLHRASRAKVPFPVVALVGYTNAGKSTLFNRMTGAEVLVRDMLFATLDPTMRAVLLPSGRKVIASDTVGFISDLPTQLVAAFRATLEEVLSADMILHVRDIAHPESAEQAADVEDILGSLGVDKATPIIEVWNKIDLVEGSAQQAQRVQADARGDVQAVSALTGEGVAGLLDAISAALDEERTTESFHLAFADGRGHAWLHEHSVVEAETEDENGWNLTVNWTARQAKQFREL